ncbi:ABC transporter ATP-binding protein/permease [Herbiconiux sp. CPCC 205716]|uniref:ABC transporter ATP-binding protein/permease n=1 Tax=Herbiconiux gentiana TaxID=2970912 RepID=A0ABT2GAH3_9MICO|nr:ABC transporter ATP-binding protein [Herbiconiux gentiana]MCS5713165.1 ABC transporter ATP-binding protein/permease [Herbiconiux gentiana]
MTRRSIDADRPLSSLLHELRPFRTRLVIAIAVFIVKDSPLWLLPVITAAMIDVVVDGRSATEIGWLALAGAALVLQNYPTHLAFTRLYMSSVRGMAANLRNALADRLQTLSIGFHARSSASVIQSKVVRDVENLELMFLQAGNPGLSAVFVFIGAVTMTAVTVPQFLPVFALSVPAGVGVWWAMRRRSSLRNQEFRVEMERFSSRIGEMATLLPITRAHGLEHIARDRVSEVAEGVRVQGLRLDMLNGGFGAISWVALQLLSLGCLCLAGLVAVMGWATITPGQVVLLSTYFAMLTGTVTSVLNLYPLLARGTESVKSLAEIMQEPDLEFNEGKHVVASVTGRIELRNVSVRYGDEPPAVKAIDLVISPGETVALVGRSGSGKSTLMNTVLGFVRPSSGQVLLDGRDMQELDLRTVRRDVSVVPQESVMFEGSIRDNVTYGLDSVDDSAVIQALRDANALEIVDQLPRGLDTMVGERGARLSGGQRQRLSIARALIRNPLILLLDEATSALDSESEAKVQTALDTLMQNRTTLVVAHRLSTVRRADTIVVLDRGTIVERGTHDQLVSAGCQYARLWALQTGTSP